MLRPCVRAPSAVGAGFGKAGAAELVWGEVVTAPRNKPAPNATKVVGGGGRGEAMSGSTVGAERLCIRQSTAQTRGPKRGGAHGWDTCLALSNDEPGGLAASAAAGAEGREAGRARSGNKPEKRQQGVGPSPRWLVGGRGGSRVAGVGGLGGGVPLVSGAAGHLSRPRCPPPPCSATDCGVKGDPALSTALQTAFSSSPASKATPLCQRLSERLSPPHRRQRRHRSGVGPALA